MAFDLIVLTLNAYKLITTGLAGKKTVGHSAGSQIGRLIFADGLIFFFIASVFFLPFFVSVLIFRPPPLDSFRIY
jgi:hypothetical protein